MASGSLGAGARVPTSWEEYLQLGEEVRGEYFDGALVTASTPGRRHQEICFRLVALLKAHAGPNENVAGGRGWGWGWQPPTLPPVEFVPDVMVFPDTDDETRFRGVPRLVVDVLDTHRCDDLVVRATQYAHHGLRDYWVIDPASHQVLTYRLAGGTYATTGEPSHGPATLRFASTEATVDVDDLLD